MAHRPVLLTEALGFLQPQDESLLVDATFGGGGYSRALLAASRCRVVGLDRDPAAVARGRDLERLDPAFTIVEGPFGELRELLTGLGIAAVDGIAFDLGVSSFQLDEPARGFSFQADGPLDMRMGSSGPTAADLVNGLPEAELARLFATLGEEPQARAVARAIGRARKVAPIAGTGELAALVARAKGGRQGPRDPATRCFQALRMAVNDELGELDRGLRAAEALLRPGGRLVVVSFHSGEDAAVKRFVNDHGGREAMPSRHMPAPDGRRPRRWRWLRHGIVRPGPAELQANPRARSARLRAAERLAAPAADEEEGSWLRAA